MPLTRLSGGKCGASQLDTTCTDQRCQFLSIHIFISWTELARERDGMSTKLCQCKSLSMGTDAHVASPTVHFTFSDPSVFSILNNVNIHTIADHSEASAMCLPGLHKLCERGLFERFLQFAHQIRRPNPYIHGILSLLSVPLAAESDLAQRPRGLDTYCRCAIPPCHTIIIVHVHARG